MIGVFDSGYGGLTVLHGIIEKLPQYSYMYLADNDRAPYGSRSQEEILEFTTQGVEYLFNAGCQMVILGCNTASAVALRQIQQKWLPQHYPDRKVLGILVPTIEQITGATWRHTEPITTPISHEVFTVGVLATPSTVESGAYEAEIHKRNRSIKVIQQACTDLATSIERNDGEAKIQEMISRYTRELMEKVGSGKLRAVLLGCTHYELISKSICLHLPDDAKLYHQPTIIAVSLKAYLQHHLDIASRLERSGKRVFLTSSDAGLVSATAARYFGQAVTFQHYESS